MLDVALWGNVKQATTGTIPGNFWIWKKKSDVHLIFFKSPNSHIRCRIIKCTEDYLTFKLTVQENATKSETAFWPTPSLTLGSGYSGQCVKLQVVFHILPRKHIDFYLADAQSQFWSCHNWSMIGMDCPAGWQQNVLCAVLGTLLPWYDVLYKLYSYTTIYWVGNR
jgi:hypothetical protein